MAIARLLYTCARARLQAFSQHMPYAFRVEPTLLPQQNDSGTAIINCKRGEAEAIHDKARLSLAWLTGPTSYPCVRVGVIDFYAQ